MNRIAILLIVCWPTALWAVPVNASIEQQADIWNWIQKAQRTADDFPWPECKYSSSPEYCNVKEIKMKIEKDMGIGHDSLGNPSRVPTQEDLKNISGGFKFWQDKRGDYAKVTKAYEESRGKAAEYYKEAMRRTTFYYNLISPDPEWRNGGPVTNGPPWWIGKQVNWDAHFSTKPQPDEAADPAEAFEKSARTDPGRWRHSYKTHRIHLSRLFGHGLAS